MLKTCPINLEAGEITQESYRLPAFGIAYTRYGNQTIKKTLPHGEIGELAVRGYNMKEYYNQPEKTSEVIDDEGWLYTGDLAKY